MQGASQIGSNWFLTVFGCAEKTHNNRRTGILGWGVDWLNQCGFVVIIGKAGLTLQFCLVQIYTRLKPY